MARKIVLTGVALTDPTAPKLAAVDPLLPEDGALVYLDPTHPYQQWTVADPVTGQLYPNLAYDEAKALIPAGTATTLGASLVYGSSVVNNGVGNKIERTVKNGQKAGLHVIESPTVVGDANRTIRIVLGSALNAYVLANKAHSFYTALWGRITRAHPTWASSAPRHAYSDAANNVFGFYSRLTATGDTQHPIGGTRLGHYGEGVLSVVSGAPFFQDVAVANASAMTVMSGYVFNRDNSVGNATLRPGSMAFYGCYMEDLTVSGRTYAEVHELLLAKYAKDVKTAGGRYYGNTYTDPTTVP